VEPSVGLDDLETKTIPCPYRESNLRTPSPQSSDYEVYANELVNSEKRNDRKAMGEIIVRI